ncbi:S-adenosyl-L-methionine-dependent methyltransferase [Truncatella angustata]|uniref:S-adenosyl-L-methionine-dependent methyltransferase n=1 Tax=Truncatella angustata TaxID=152316 RepID=A0A9P8UPP7_9PEZI|nr:S-adenosyl-L-methionine-dependent methyltransferase [Truncatella angustata]KAH6656072.1 S-adenosyl-L-methionine-dependent methyltransferase [Truncatella angustata]KAH8202358.1 hypothetical protein TruAng_003431 [Truncatella angustata]
MADGTDVRRHQARPSLSETISTTLSTPSLLIDHGSGATDGDDGDDTDLSSVDDTSFVSSTRSLNSSEYQTIEEHGRTYHRFHASKMYDFPNDAEEQERMDLQHELYLHSAHQRLYLAPIPEDPPRVLDVCTGTGIWAVQFAQQNPHSHVIGTDLSPIQPRWVPPNCSFEIDDAEDEWTFDRPFDFVHARGIWPVFADPTAFIRQAYANLKPGGWLEIQDFVFPIRFFDEDALSGSALQRWGRLMLEASRAAGRPYTNSQHHKQWLEDAGFEDVQVFTSYWLSSPWAKGAHYKLTAEFMKENAKRGLVGMSLRPLGSLGLAVDEIQDLAMAAIAEFGDVRIKGYAPVTFTFGRRPDN